MYIHAYIMSCVSNARFRKPAKFSSSNFLQSFVEPMKMHLSNDRHLKLSIKIVFIHTILIGSMRSHHDCELYNSRAIFDESKCRYADIWIWWAILRSMNAHLLDLSRRSMRSYQYRIVICHLIDEMSSICSREERILKTICDSHGSDQLLSYCWCLLSNEPTECRMFKHYRYHANEPHASIIDVQSYSSSGKWIDSSMSHDSSSSSSSSEQFESSSVELDSSSSSTSSSEPIVDSSNASTLEIAVICGSVLFLLLVIVGFCLYRQHRNRIFRRRADSLHQCLVEQSPVQSEFVPPIYSGVKNSSHPQRIPVNATSPIQESHRSFKQSITPPFTHYNHLSSSSSLPIASTAASVTRSFDASEQSRYVSFPHSSSHGNTSHASRMYSAQTMHQQSSNHSQPPASKAQQSFFLARPVASSAESSAGSGPNQMNYRFTMSTRVTGSAPDVDSCFEEDDDFSDTDSMEGEDLICSTEKVDEAELVSHSASSVQFVRWNFQTCIYCASLPSLCFCRMYYCTVCEMEDGSICTSWWLSYKLKCYVTISHKIQRCCWVAGNLLLSCDFPHECTYRTERWHVDRMDLQCDSVLMISAIRGVRCHTVEPTNSHAWIVQESRIYACAKHMIMIVAYPSFHGTRHRDRHQRPWRSWNGSLEYHRRRDLSDRNQQPKPHRSHRWSSSNHH